MSEEERGLQGGGIIYFCAGMYNLGSSGIRTDTNDAGNTFSEITVNYDFIPGWGKDPRTYRFDELRAEGKTLGEINDILCQEGFGEVSGEGVMPCPTKHHEIIRANKGVKAMIAKGALK